MNKPLSKETRFDINEQLRHIQLEPSEGWFTKDEMLEVLAAEAYWREAVKKTRQPFDDGRGNTKCPVCDEWYAREEDHGKSCPWVIAQGIE